ncbi:MAG: hypothetical protein AAB074_11565 [Planctomycetota bacterium]
MLRAAALALLALPALAQLPDTVREPHRTVVVAAKESKFFSAKRYDALIARFDGPLDPEGAQALFRDMVQLAYDHENGEDYVRMLCRDLEREDMKAVGWAAVPDEIEVEKLALPDGRVLFGTGGLLATRHPELEPRALAGQRLLFAWVGVQGLGKFWIAKEQFKNATRAKVKMPRAIPVGIRSERIDEKGRLVLDGEWIRIGKGRVKEAIALDVVDVGDGGTLFANETEGLRTARVTASFPDLAKANKIPEKWREAFGWDARPPLPAEETFEEPKWITELVEKAPDAWPAPYDGPRRLLDKAASRVDLVDADAEASLLRLRFFLTYGDDLPGLAIGDPRAMKKLEDAVRDFLRGKSIEPVLKLRPDVKTVAAVLCHMPDLDPAPEDGVTDDNVWLRFPKDYSPWKRFPLLLVLHGQYQQPEWDYQCWTSLPETAGMILAAPKYGSTAGTTRSPKSDDEVLRVVRKLCLERNVDPDRVVITGVSMGGAMTWRLAQSYPSRWAACGPEIHGPKPYDDKFPQLRNVARVPIFQMEGEFDGLNTIYSRQAAALLKSWEAPFVYHEARNYGHDRMAWLYPRFLEWSSLRTREAHPSKVEHWCLNAWEGESHWLAIRRATKANAFGMKDGAFNPVDLCGVEAHYADGVMTLRVLGGKPAEVELFHDDRVMTAEEIRIEGATKPLKWKPKPDLKKLLERARESGEREALYGDSIKVELR